MKLRSPIVTLVALILVTSIASLGGCSKDKGTNPTPTPTPTPTPESFNSGDLVMGTPFTHPFNTAGTYPYRCLHHSTSLTSGMVGTVIVADASTNMGFGVNVTSNSFSPGSVTIKTGTSVTWTLVNGTHTVTRP